MALTSNTGTVVGSDVTFINQGKGLARGDKIVLYIDYTLGGSDTGIVLTVSFNDSDIDTNYYERVISTAGALTTEDYTFSATGKLRLPLENSKNEENVKITVAGLVDGSLNLEFGVDNGFR